MFKGFSRLTRKIRKINAAYSKPRIEMSPMVKLSLLSLRVYLFVLVALMLYKFATLVGA